MVPLWLFSVENLASLREPTALDLSRQILQQFACDGFVTAGNPVLIRIQAGLAKPNTFPQWLGVGFFHQSPFTTSGPAQDEALTQSKEEIPSGGLWFLKGAGRIHTVMALMVYISKHTTATLEVRGVATTISLYSRALNNTSCFFPYWFLMIGGLVLTNEGFR